MEWALGIALVLGATFLFLFLRERRRYRKLCRLQEQLTGYIEQFLAEPIQTNFSLKDDEGAKLQNCIARLQEEIILSRNRLQKERRRNHHFIADISHQLKTPLASLRLYSDLAAADGASAADYSGKIVLLIERMEKLVYQLLRLEKLRAGAYELNYADVDVRELLEEQWHELLPMYPEYRLVIQGDLHLRLDPFWMQEAFHNILKNSCEQKAEKPEILVSLSQSKSLAHLVFEDYGGGVDTFDVSELFDRFSRSATVADTKKSGLGLAITKAIVESHHGSIFAENTKEGLRISLYLPIHAGYRSY